ncbi:MAG: hypothetical protein WCT54_05620, partial [Patescibacteria group bacterium]
MGESLLPAMCRIREWHGKNRVLGAPNWVVEIVFGAKPVRRLCIKMVVAAYCGRPSMGAAQLPNSLSTRKANRVDRGTCTGTKRSPPSFGGRIAQLLPARAA